MKTVRVVLTGLLCASVMPAALRADEEEVRKALRDYVEAFNKQELESVGKAWAADAEHVELNPFATSLRGHSGNIDFSKIAGERTRGNINIGYRSPGFEVNDLGFQRRADEIPQNVWVQYRWNNPGKYKRNGTINFNQWSAHNFDLSAEAYHVKGAVISAGVFRKDITDFFGTVQIPATEDLLTQYGLTSDYLDYDVVTRTNFGEATITGFEFSWRQTLHFLPDWARGFQVFFNATRLRRSGANAADFSSFSPLNINWGGSYVRKRVAVKLNIAYSGEVKGNRIAPSAAVPVDTFQHVAPKTTVDLYTEFRLLKRLSLYASASNLTGEPKRTLRYAPSTPDYARPFRYQDFGTLVTVGARYDF